VNFPTARTARRSSRRTRRRACSGVYHHIAGRYALDLVDSGADVYPLARFSLPMPNAAR